MIQSLVEEDINVKFLVQLDKLIRLLETPIFAYLRLQVLKLKMNFIFALQVGLTDVLYLIWLKAEKNIFVSWCSCPIISVLACFMAIFNLEI